jgi:small subunit ribosomal protein S8
MTDPIADMLCRIQNGINTRAETVDLPHSRVKEALAKILVDEGYLYKSDTLKRMEKMFLRIGLKYKKDKRSVIAGLKRISRPGKRIYVDRAALPRVQDGYGTAIVSTSKGIMTDEQARQQKLGGEVMVYIW